MDEFQWLPLFHVVGYGLIAGLLVIGWLVQLQYTKANDCKTKAAILPDGGFLTISTAMVPGPQCLSSLQRQQK